MLPRRKTVSHILAPGSPNTLAISLQASPVQAILIQASPVQASHGQATLV